MTLPIEHFHLLSQPLRLAILRRLMAAPATLSQLGLHFGETPAHIRHHLKILEAGGLVRPAPGHPQHNHLEKYYQAAADVLHIHQAVLPEPPAGQTPVILGSKDAASRRLAEHLNQQRLGFFLQVISLNSLDGLLSLRQGVCHMTTCHLLDAPSGEYNRPHVRHFFPGQEMTIIQLYWREEGLVVRPGNPLHIQEMSDLARPGVRLVNREPGSGIRTWLDLRLKQLGIPPGKIFGYINEVGSHDAVAQAVLQGNADAGLAITASARKYGLGFVPLFSEPYELVLPTPLLSDPRLAPFFEQLNARVFRRAIHSLDGYTILDSAGQAESLAG